MEKQNDWLATIFFNPDKGTDSFRDAGLTPDNTIMYDKDHYQNIKAIQDKFTIDGQFDQEKFDKYYDSALRTYNSFVNDDLINKNIQTGGLGYFSIYGKGSAPIFGITKISNPEQRNIGISSLFGVGEAKLSMREAAQNNYVRDSKGNVLDYTPNDDNRRGLNFFGNKPLYYAKYEEDGYHLNADGVEVPHYKGEYKLDENGVPFVQELGEGEDTLGKEFVSITDTLTVDGSDANKYDIFDSDGIDKSVGKSVAKMIATVAPVFIPYVGEIYAYGLVAGNAADALSAIGKVGLELFDQDYKDNNLWKLLNNTQAYTKSYITDRVLSDKGKESFWNIENLSNLVSDVATQGIQQRVVAQGAIKFMKALGYDNTGMNIQKQLIAKYGDEYLKKYGKSLNQAILDGDINPEFYNLAAGKYFKTINDNRKLANSFARASSSWYMALTQSSDIVESMKENGFNSTYTAAATLAGLFGFKKIMDSELGDVALKGLGLDEVGKAVKKNLKDLTKESQEEFSKLNTKSGVLAWIDKTSTNISNKVQNLMLNSEFMESALKEGAEEVSEEVLQDIIMGGASNISWSLKQLGLDDKNKGSWSYLDSNPLERYLTSFVGGAIGGPINRGIDIVKNWKAYKATKFNQSDLDFVDLVRKYGKEPILQELNKYKKKGLFPKNLSLNLNDSLGNFTPAKEGDSQNDILFDYLSKYVEYWDRLIHEEGASISDEDLINEALRKDYRVSILKNYGLGSEVINNFNTLLIKLANANLEYKNEYYSTRDEQKPNNPRLNEIKKTADSLREQIKNLKNGLFAEDFLDKTIFKLNRSLAGSLYTPDIYMYALSINKNYSTADEITKKSIEESYENFKKENKDSGDLSYEIFKTVKNLTQTDLADIKNTDINYLKQLREGLQRLLEDSELNISPSKEDLDNLIKLKRNNKSDDELIEELHLNKQNNVLSEEQKKLLVENKLSELVQIDLNRKANILFDNYYQLGLDTRFFGDINKLNQVIDLLSELKTKYGYIDTDTASKVKNIIDKVNVKDFSIDDAIENSLNLDNFNNSFYLNNNYDYLFESFIGAGQNAENSDISELSIEKNEDGTYNLSLIGVTETNYNINKEKVKELLKALINIKSPVDSFTDFDNIDEDFNFLKENYDSKTAITLIEKADSLLQSPNVKDISSKLIGKISQAIYGKDLNKSYYRILESLINSKSLVDFSISDSSLLEDIDKLSQVINLTNALLIYSTDFKGEDDIFDFINVVNKFRRDSGIEELQTLTPEATNEISNQLQLVNSATYLLKEIAKTNNEGKIKENKFIHSKVIGEWINVFFKDLDLKQIILNGKQFFDLNNDNAQVEEIINKNNQGVDLTSDELILLENTLLKVQTYYYNKFNSLSEEDKDKLIDAFASFNPYGTLPIKINREFDYRKLDTESKITFLLSTFSIDPDLLKSTYLETLNEEEFNYIVPFYSQRLTVEEIVSAFNGKDIFNKYLEKVGEKYLNNKWAITKNTSIVFGSAGSGKTDVVARLIKNVISKLDQNIQFISYAWKEDRSLDLHKRLNTNEQYSGESIYSKWFTPEVISEITKYKQSITRSNKLEELKNPTELNDKVKEFLNKIDLNKTKNKTIIFVDEVTHLSNFEIKLLSSIPNVYVIGLGDNKQDGFKGTLLGEGGLSLVKTPTLDVSIRANNNIKKDNINKLATLIDNIQRENEKFKVTGTGAANVIGALNLITQDGFFNYYDNGTSLIKGEKVVQEIKLDEIKKMISNLKEGENIAYIYDNTTKSKISNFDELQKLVDSGKFILVDKDRVQGSEYTYSIINVGYTTTDNTSRPEEILLSFNQLYTWITRSKEGSIIVNNNNFKLGLSRANSSYSDIKFNNEEINNYKEFINSVYKNLNLTKSEKTNTESTTIKSNIGKPDKETAESGHKVISNIKEIKEQPNDFVVYQSHLMYNFGENSNRNLSKWERNSEVIKNFNILKNLLFRSKIELNEILNNPDSYQRDLINKAFSLFQKYGLSTIEEVKDLINNSNYFIEKVNYNDSFKSEDNHVNSNIITPDSVYRIYIQLGNWQIDLGIISNPDNLPDSEARNILINLDYNKPIKLDSNKMDIRFAKAKITKVSDPNISEQYFSFESNNIQQFIDNNPWANVAPTIWVANKESEAGNIKVGYPFVFYTRDLFKNPESLKTLFENGLETGEDSDIIPLQARLHGYNFKEYLSKWRSLYGEKNGKRILKFKSFAGPRQAIFIYKQFLAFSTYITAKKEGQDAEKALENINGKNFKSDFQLYESKLASYDINTLFDEVSLIRENWNNTISKLSSDFKIDWNHLDAKYFNEATQSFFKDKLNNTNLFNTIQTINNISDITKYGYNEDVAKLILDGINKFKRLYEEFNKEISENPNIWSKLQNINADEGGFTELNSELIDWLIVNNYIPNFIGSTMMLHTLSKVLSDNDNLIEVMSLALDGTKQYKDGIWVNGVFSDMKENGFYKSNNTIRDLYFNSLIEIPNAYISLDSISLEKKGEKIDLEEESTETEKETFNSEYYNISLQEGNKTETLIQSINNIKKEELDGNIVIDENKAYLLQISDRNLNVLPLNKRNLENINFNLFNNSEDSEEFKVTNSNYNVVEIKVNNGDILINFNDSEYFKISNYNIEKIDMNTYSLLSFNKPTLNDFINTLKESVDNVETIWNNPDNTDIIKDISNLIEQLLNTEPNEIGEYIFDDGQKVELSKKLKSLGLNIIPKKINAILNNIFKETINCK